MKNILSRLTIILSLLLCPLVFAFGSSPPSNPPPSNPPPTNPPPTDPPSTTPTDPAPPPSNDGRISSIGLYNMSTGKLIKKIASSSTVSLSEADLSNANIAVNVQGSYGSVWASWDSKIRTISNDRPNWLFASANETQEEFVNGWHSLSLRTYEKSDAEGKVLGQKNISFRVSIKGSAPVVPPQTPNPPVEPPEDSDPNEPRITGFMLYDDVRHTNLKSISNNGSLDLSNVSKSAKLNIRAVVTGTISRIDFAFDDLEKRSETGAPFTAFKEDGSGNSFIRKNGKHAVSARAINGNVLTFKFTVKGAVSAPPPVDPPTTPPVNPPNNPNPPTTPTPPDSNYDARKDPAYKGYKYKPGEGYSVKKFKLPPRPNCVKEVKNTISVSGTFDGKGCLYTFKGTWKGKSYKDICFAPKEISEGMPPMFDLKPGATLKNVQIECALDGIHTSKNNTIDNVFMRDVEEDAITANTNITIKNSQFWFCNDKCIQMNRANKVTVLNNKFYYTQSAVLANYGNNVEVKGNYFYETKKAIRSRTSDSRVVAQNNVHEGGSCYVSAQDKGILEDWGGNKLTNVKEEHCEINGGKITRK